MKAIRNQDGSTHLPDHAGHWRNFAWWPYVQRLKHSDAPIFVGPWRGEVGFEALYWIPYLAQFAHLSGIPMERLIPISRGGASAWYGTPTGLELYAMRTPQQVRVANREQVERTGMFKQDSMTPFDRQVIRDAADTMNVKQYHVLHPAWMYTRLAPYWTMMRGMTWVNARLRFAKLVMPTVSPTMGLPDDFVAVRFYSRQTFYGKQLRAFIEAVIGTLAQEVDVVILDSALVLDDHMDLTADVRGDRVHHLSDYTPLIPETNLATLSAVVGRARGFVGTYGGFAQLALRAGIPSASFYTEWGHTSIAHAELAHVLAVRSGVPAHVIRVGDIAMLNQILPHTTVTVPSPSPLALQEA